jgi:DNA-directed RNA polymerase sigma subunit (sigma70/sigma32)
LPFSDIYGQNRLDGKGGCVLDDLGRELRVTRSRVGQIEARALDWLAREMDRLEEREGRHARQS